MTDKSDERKALAELVACKDLKDRIDSFSHTPECLAAPWTECPQALMEAEYKRRQPAAWANARAVLATAPAEPPEPPKEPPVPYFANDDELRKTLRILDFTLATYGDDDSFPIGARLMRALLYRLQEGHTMSAPEKWRIEAVHASGCIHYTNEMACDCGLLEAARDTFPSPPSGEVAALIRDCANTLDQLFRQRHTMKDVETELRRFARLVNSNPSCNGRAPCSIEDCRWPDCE